MKARTGLSILSLLVSAVLVASASAEVYKWVDDQGRVHYGDRPAGKQADKAKPVDIKSSPSSAAPDSGQRDTRQRDSRNVLRSLEEARRERERALREQQEKRQEKRRDQAKCRDMINKLKDIERGGNIWYSLDDQGEREYWDKARLNQEIEMRRQNITSQCGKKALK